MAACDCSIDKLVAEHAEAVQECKRIGATVCLNFIPWDREKGIGHLYCRTHRVYVTVEGLVFKQPEPGSTP